MKKHKVLTLSILAAIAMQLKGQQFQLPGQWKFHVGDSTAWATTGYNDDHWRMVTIGRSWQDNGIKHEGFACMN